MIEVDSLTKYYGETRAVGPLSFSIEMGEVVGLLGLNGAGKTTTLRMLASDLMPTSGTMRVAGEDLALRPERIRQKIGYLPDRPPLYSDMTVREYLRFAGQLRGMKSGLKKRINEVIDMVDVGDYADALIDTLSHGYRQRVGIAQAIIHRPALLLLDEPISGLDPRQIVEMRSLLRSLRGEHVVVVSSHILSEISETCDRILVIRDGELVASGTEAELVVAGGQAIAAGESASEQDATAGTEAENATGVGLTLVVALANGQIVDADAEASLEQLVLGVDAEAAVRVGSSPEGEGTATLTVRCDHDIRVELCRALVENDVGLLSLNKDSALERAFLNLTRAGEDQ